MIKPTAALIFVMFSSLAFAGGAGGTGTPPALEADDIVVDPALEFGTKEPILKLDPKTGLTHINPRLKEIHISEDKMKQVIDAVNKEKKIYLNADVETIIPVTPDSMHFPTKSFRIQLENGQNLILRQVTPSN